ncbi:protein unc-13 homolog 4B [Folsomia candida]|uniref:protein unc-13 homolog 4B n=1 Tax=Folsomia candida TaxID=158441 RepID=UPI00160523C7|nr:protein unc-13 homolog 4B [Folsomia candida]
MDESIFPIIRNHLKETEGQVSKALKAYKNCEDVLSKYEPSFALPVIRGLLEKALRLCFLEWYQATYALRVQSVRSVDECQRVKLYVDVITDVNKLLTIGMKRWHPEFWMLAQYESYTPIMYDELQKMVNHDIEMICWSLLRHYNDNKRLRKMLTDRNRKENECTISALFSLYAGTQTFVEAQHQIFTESPQYDNLANYHKWFRPILVLWLGFAVIRGSEIITRCVNIDTVSMDNIHAQTSTSALDTAAVIHQLVQFWERLMWPDVCENYVIIHFLIEVMCYFTVLYAERKLEKLELEGYFDTIDQFDISERLCIALNNIEYVKEALEGIPEEIKYDALIRELEDKCGITRETYNYRIRLKQVFTFTYVNVDLIFNSILEGVGKRVRPEIKRCVRDCLEIVQANLSRSGRESSRDALDPIFNYIDSNIITLAKSLLTLNFARMLQLFWDIILRELLYAGSNVEVKGGEQQKTVFDRLLTMLPMLRTYFHNNDGGLSEDELNTPVYWEVHDVMNMYTLETPAIISHFYRVRGDSQVSDPKTAPYGILTVRASYWNGKLTVEVIAAYNLVAMDDAFQLWNLCMKSQPSNDPYVEVEIQPERKFSNIRTSRTKVQRKTVNPTFNEKFHWDVSQEESGQEDAVILFTVKDYDFLSHNDFLGEAVVPFSKIPGIAAKPIPQPMHLNLRVVEPSHTLHIFKSRHWDPESQRFYERHAKRGSVE